MGWWWLVQQILAVLEPSKKTPGREGAAEDMKRGLTAVYGPAVPHIFYISFGGGIGDGTMSCCHDNVKIK